MKSLLFVFILFTPFFTFAQVADFTQMDQFIIVTPYDSSFVNFHPHVTHAQKLGIVGQDIYLIDKKCRVEAYELDVNGVIPDFSLNCQGKKIKNNLYFDYWYIIGGLEKINAEYKGIEFKFDHPNEETIFGIDDRIFSKKDRFIIKEIRYGKINKTTFSLVVFFENGYIESMEFLDFKPHFKSEMKSAYSSNASIRAKDSIFDIVIIVDDKKMLAIE
jgi:hypothetical protein